MALTTSSKGRANRCGNSASTCLCTHLHMQAQSMWLTPCAHGTPGHHSPAAYSAAPACCAAPCQALRQKLEKSEDKLVDFRDKLTTTRQDLTAKERQLDVAKRMITRLSEEKSQAEVREHRVE